MITPISTLVFALAVAAPAANAATAENQIVPLETCTQPLASMAVSNAFFYQYDRALWGKPGKPRFTATRIITDIVRGSGCFRVVEAGYAADTVLSVEATAKQTMLTVTSTATQTQVAKATIKEEAQGFMPWKQIFKLTTNEQMVMFYAASGYSEKDTAERSEMIGYLNAYNAIVVSMRQLKAQKP